MKTFKEAFFCFFNFLFPFLFSVLVRRDAVHFFEGADEILTFVVAAFLGDFLDCEFGCVQKAEGFFVHKKMDVGLRRNTKCLLV